MSMRVCIVGISGFGGAEVMRLIASRPFFELIYAAGEGSAGNHIGGEVDDLDAIESLVIAAGLTPFSHDDYDPGRRFYFFDPDGIEYEVVSYRRVDKS